MNKMNYRQAWVRAGYIGTMGSVQFVPPPPDGVIRVYHFLSTEFGLEDIEKSRIKVARISDLNDPYELFSVNVRDRRVHTLVTNFKNQYNSHTGLLCFSSDWTSPVLWSHYGDSHRGICLGFDLRRGLEIKVKYADQKILARGENQESLTEVSAPLQESLLCTKYKHWEYESEVRLPVPLGTAVKEGDKYFYYLDSDLTLAEVILGLRCDLKVEEVRNLVDSRYVGVKTLKARLNKKHFGVVPDEASIAW